jgi:hypothetical protein
MDEYEHLRQSSDAEAQRLRNERHLAAFMGDCGVATCDLCHPAPTFRPAMQGIPVRDIRDEDRWIEAIYGGRVLCQGRDVRIWMTEPGR